VVVPKIEFNDDVTNVFFDCSILDNNKLDICLVQTPAPDFSLIKADQTRPLPVKVVQDLLVGGAEHVQPVLTELLPRTKMTLILMPEFAFAHEDWDELNSAIRASVNPVILIAGFGATVGGALLKWRDEPSDTFRHWGWNESISNIKVVNGGWCWVHQPGYRTDCFVWMKNVAEQRVEAVHLQNMQFGHEVLHLRFNDLSIFPVICADLLDSLNTNGSTQEKISKAIAVDQRPNTPVLITGSLWQLGYNRNWEVAIGNILHHVVKDRPAAVVLCNIAHDDPQSLESSDKWRSMSGVFVKFDDLPRCQQHLHAGRALETASMSGVVIRDSRPCLVGGKVSWRPYNPVAGQFLWHSDVLCLINDHGVDLLSSTNNTTIRCEVKRNLRRFPSSKDWDPRVARGISDFVSKSEVFPELFLERLVAYILEGLSKGATFKPDLLHENESYREGIYALAALKTLDNADWLMEEDQDGHLVSSGVVNMLVWNERRRTYKFVRRQVEEWLEAPIPHPNLIIFSCGAGDVKEGEVFIGLRSNISAPSPEILGLDNEFFGGVNNISGPKIIRRAALYSVDKVSAMYKDFVPSEAADRASELQSVIVNAFGGRR